MTTQIQQHDTDLLNRIHDLLAVIEDEAFQTRYNLEHTNPVDPNDIGDDLETLRIFSLDLISLADRWNGTQRTQPMEAD